MALSKKYRCLNVGNCETANQNKVFEIQEGTDPVCPDCGKNMLVEVKGKKPVMLIVTILALVGAAVACFCIWGLDKEVEKTDTENSETVAVTADSAATEEPAIVEPTAPEPVAVDEPVVEQAKAAGETTNVSKQANTPAAPKTSVEGYNLGWGRYSGPAKNGKPDGLGGEITVTRSYTLDLHDGGNTIEFAPGDKITRVKIKDGKLLQGLLTRPDNSSRHFSAGV